MCVCLSVCVCAAAGQWELNANSSEMVKATDLKFLLFGTVFLLNKLSCDCELVVVNE